MDYNLVELEFFRLYPHVQSLKQNHYPDERIYHYQLSLLQLYENIEQKINENYYVDKKRDELFELSKILIFVKTSIECLKDSTLNLIPFEALFCLEAALKDWTEDNRVETDDKRIENVLVITHQYREYYYDSMLSGEGSFFLLFAKKYNVQFKQRLILISIPKFELNDYLSHVVLYHELGHFIERRYKVVDKIFEAQFKKPLTKEEVKEWVKRKFYYCEYFCDLFAAQYIGDCCSKYLNYIANGAIETETHPSTKSRIEIVDAFLNNKKNAIVEELKFATRQMTKASKLKTQNLQIRVKPIEKTDFINLIPCEIWNADKPRNSDTEQEELKSLHYLFVMGWELWLGKEVFFKEYGFTKIKIYEVINNLIEKSISNYIVQRLWNNPKHTRHVPE